MGMNKYLFESDYSADSLRWIKKCEEKNLKPFSSIVNDDFGLNKLENLQTEIIEASDSALAYFFACEYPYKIYRMQKVILDKKDAKFALLFAQNIKHCDIKALQNIVVESKKTKYICKFACFVKGAERKPLEK